MGYESEIQVYENEPHTHVAFDDYKLVYLNEEEYESEDEEYLQLYDELWEETPYDVEYDWYQEDLEQPSLLPVSSKRYRNKPWVWYHTYHSRT